MRRIGLATVVTLAIAGTTGVTGSASATVNVSCVYNGGSKVLTVTGHGGIPALNVSGSQIVVKDYAATVICSGGTPTTTNTDTVVINDDPGLGTYVRIEDPQAFAPGATAEGSPDFPFPSEIEFQANLGDGNDIMYIHARNSGVEWHLGTAGVNFVTFTNITLYNDVDLTVNGLNRIFPVGGNANDVITGAGGAGTGNPYPYRMYEFGGGRGDDLDIGGAANDVIGGSGSGADDIRGGGGIDTVDYSADPTPGVHVSIGDGPNDGHASDESATSPGTFDDVRSSVENIIGTKYNDVLVGDDGPNRIEGDLGADSLFGYPGDDLLVAADGVADTQINCGGGSGDFATVDPVDPAPVSC